MHWKHSRHYRAGKHHITFHQPSFHKSDWKRKIHPENKVSISRESKNVTTDSTRATLQCIDENFLKFPAHAENPLECIFQRSDSSLCIRTVPRVSKLFPETFIGDISLVFETVKTENGPQLRYFTGFSPGPHIFHGATVTHIPSKSCLCSFSIFAASG